MKICYLSEVCPQYTNGSKRRGHHIRLTEPCQKHIDMSCKMALEIQAFLGETIACDIKKVKRIKGELNE